MAGHGVHEAGADVIGDVVAGEHGTVNSYPPPKPFSGRIPASSVSAGSSRTFRRP
jgi:hypothetical protein